MARRGIVAVALGLAATMGSASCGWQGANSIPLPGTQGRGAGAYTIQAQLPDVSNVERNSRVRVGDVNVGTVTDIQRQGWHALVTMTINGDIHLPANATATVGQTSVFGTRHIELAAPTSTAPQGVLRNGSLIPLSSGRAYPTIEKTLAAVSLLFNGGGIGQIQEITRSLSTAFAGRENDLRSLIEQLSTFTGNLNDQIGDIIAATDSLNALVIQIADQKPVLDKAIKVIPDALAVLSEQRQHLADALDSLGKFSALSADVVIRTKDSIVNELKQLGPVVQSLADSGQALTRSLSVLSTYPWHKEGLPKWMRGDYANSTLVIDLTLSRIDNTFFTGTRWEGNLTELEMQWGRTIGQIPSPYTAGNPLVAPYRRDQGR
ncbi:mammalian cell entry protein [Mycobacterium florentinum]|uniref:Mammalian cell entry protein n=1 Tax=Mycobacterium florentinum TaxID=292462 RepID=A0A1X1TU07_MYCFL|nr:MCE family protein [Mycobacterium florentinum]MCV7408519.1 MCE family protein [Mycobacterium florentinum]ORV48043.1 mammalian cell entry protein [Mycobacterium florentinum]